MKVIYRLEKTSQSIVIDNVLNTYQKGDFYCIYFIDKNSERVVKKIPIDHLFDVDEPY